MVAFLSMKIEELPNDINELKKLFIKEIDSKEREISQLKDTILLLQRKKFGPSSEASKDQLMLFNELEDVVDTEEGDEDEEITYKRKKRGKRSPLPPELPRVEEVIDLTDEEKEGMKCIGEEATEKLEITPAKVFVRRIVRKKYAPIEGGDETIKIAPVPAELLPKSMASASLMAYIITAKYCDALPLYRQEHIFKRISAEITRQSMARWLIKVSDQLVPLYNLLQEKLLTNTYIQMDETTVQVLKEDGKKATSKSYMWVRHAPGEQPILLFDYAPRRAGTVPLELLDGFKGYLQVDGYDGYSSACEQYKLDRLGCWDHCRRKFFEASKTSNGKGIGKKGIDRIKKLYKIEDKIRHLSPEEKKNIRKEKSLPLLEEFKSWIDGLRGKITPESRAGKAITYACNEWNYLVRYVEDGRLNISNAWVENAIRPFCKF